MREFIYHREEDRIGVSVPKDIDEEDVGLIVGTLLGKTAEKGRLDLKEIVQVLSKVVDESVIQGLIKELSLIHHSMQEEDKLFQRTEGLN